MDLKADKPMAGEYRAITSPQETFSKQDLIGDSFSDEKKIDIVNSMYSPDSTIPPHGSEHGVSKETDMDHYQECFSEEIPIQDDVDSEDAGDDVRVGNTVLDEQVEGEIEEDDSCDILNEGVGEQAVALFKQLLYINASSPQEKGIVHFEPRTSGDSERQDIVTSETAAETTLNRDSSDGRSVFQPTRIINGKQVRDSNRTQLLLNRP